LNRCTKLHWGTQLGKIEKKSLALQLKKHITTLESLTDPSYNILFNNFYDENGYSHFFIEIVPRFNNWAGFEFLTGTIINPTSPEDAAKFYRKEE